MQKTEDIKIPNNVEELLGRMLIILGTGNGIIKKVLYANTQLP